MGKFGKKLKKVYNIVRMSKRFTVGNTKDQNQVVEEILQNSSLKEAITQFYHMFPSGPVFVSNKILNRFEFLKTVETALKGKVDKLISLLSSKTEELIRIERVRDNFRNTQNLFERYSTFS